MVSSDVVLGIVFTFQICVGFLGNSLLFMSYLHSVLAQPHLKKPVDKIIIHLALVNGLTIMCRLIPEITASFGVRRLMDDVGCKAVLFIYRVSLSLSICTTALLSVSQAIIISPSNSEWTWLKLKLSTYVFPSLLFFWIFNMLIYVRIILSVGANDNGTVVGAGFHQAYCKAKHFEYNHSVAVLSFMVICELVFVGLTTWTSVFVVSVLIRHHRAVRHIHSTGLSPWSSPEHRATRSILVLVSYFVFLYCINSFFSLYWTYGSVKDLRMERITGIISSAYPTLSPFILLKKKKIISEFTSFFSK